METAAGVAEVDLESGEIVGLDDGAALERNPPELGLPLVVAADSSSATVVAVVARRPPLVISRDAGSTWREAGHGLPPGAAVAISRVHPDLMLFAGSSRLYVTRDGGRFWDPLPLELDGITAVAWLEDEI